MPEIGRRHPDRDGFNYSGDPTKPPHLFPQQTSKAESELKAMHEYYKKRVAIFLMAGTGIGCLVGYIIGLFAASVNVVTVGSDGMSLDVIVGNHSNRLSKLETDMVRFGERLSDTEKAVAEIKFTMRKLQNNPEPPKTYKPETYMTYIAEPDRIRVEFKPVNHDWINGYIVLYDLKENYIRIQPDEGGEIEQWQCTVDSPDWRLLK